MLYRRKDKLAAINRGSRVFDTEREELLKLYKENRNLRMEKEF
jgi:hypothetical protein